MELELEGTKSASVEVAVGSKVFCNGIELGSEYAGETQNNFSYEPLKDKLVNPVSWTTYKVDGLLIDPELTAESPEGCSVTKTAEGDFMLCLDGAEAEKYTTRAVNFVKAYLTYYMNGYNGTWGNLYAALAYLTPGTQAYTDLQDTYNGVVWNTAYGNIDVSDTTASGVVIWADNCYSVDVTYDANCTHNGQAIDYADATMRIFSTTKLDRSAWMRFAECHVDMLPLRESAEKCGVCLKTAFFMRHRLLEAMAKRMPAFRVEAGGGAELDECFFRESFKGNRSRSESGMPRKPRTRSQGTDGHEKICVLTGINDAGDIFYEIAGRGGLDEAAARELLADKLAVGAIISTDRAHVYRRVLPALGVGAHIASKREEHAINRVNSLHSQMRHFIGRFRGVSTRRLENYLAWFKWTWCFKVRRSADELAELIVRQAARGTYEKTWRQYKVTPYPFYEYWIKQAKWDSRARRAIYGVA